jgi:hypothetical protein
MCCTSTWTPQPLKVVGAAAESAAAERVPTVPPRRGPWRGEPGEERMNRRSQRGVQRASEGASSLTVAAAATAPSRRRRNLAAKGERGSDVPAFRVACGS